MNFVFIIHFLCISVCNLKKKIRFSGGPGRARAKHNDNRAGPGRSKKNLNGPGPSLGLMFL